MNRIEIIAEDGMTSIERDIDKGKRIGMTRLVGLKRPDSGTGEKSESPAMTASLRGNRRGRDNGKFKFTERDWGVRWAFGLRASVSIKRYRQ
jgi:hypothetical protein